MTKYNDINEKEWKTHLGDITTDALWIGAKKEKDGKFIIPKRDFLPKNNSKFHGLFIPEIPYQFITRFTKKGELVWDCFAGSGTTKKVADLLERQSINTDINITDNKNIVNGDALTFNPNMPVQLIIMHPPYHNIVKYSDSQTDGSNCKTIQDFLNWFEKVAINVTKYLEKNRFLILVCGNIYSNGEEHTLGVWCKDILLKYGFKCKSQIIKDYGETKGSSAKNYNLNYYRQLKGNYNNFYGDNIFILQKIKNMEE